MSSVPAFAVIIESKSNIFSRGAKFVSREFYNFAPDHPGLKAILFERGKPVRLITTKENGLVVDEWTGDVLQVKRGNWYWKQDIQTKDNTDINDPRLCPKCLRLTRELPIQFEYDNKKFVALVRMCHRCGNPLPLAVIAEVL
jgi:hypothetical protein